MINKQVKLLSLIIFGALFINITPVKAKEDLPKIFIEKLADKMITNIITSESGDKVDKFRKLFVENLDLNAISRFVLGRYWRQLDENKKQEFIKSFTEASVLTWSGRFDEYKNEKITFYNSEPASSPNQYFVKSTISLAENNNAEVRWRIQEKNNNFKIIDIIVEGVSMAMTYRNEYNSIIQNSEDGIDALISSLNDKIAELQTK